jgi:hypothetical protein
VTIVLTAPVLLSLCVPRQIHDLKALFQLVPVLLDIITDFAEHKRAILGALDPFNHRSQKPAVLSSRMNGNPIKQVDNSVVIDFPLALVMPAIRIDVLKT